MMHRTVQDVTPFEIIREVIRLGWEVHSADLIIYELDKIEATNTDLLDVVKDCVNFLADLDTQTDRSRALSKRAYTAHSKAKSHADTLKGE